jgi:hypothetical protein
MLTFTFRFSLRNCLQPGQTGLATCGSSDSDHRGPDFARTPVPTGVIVSDVTGELIPRFCFDKIAAGAGHANVRPVRAPVSHCSSEPTVPKRIGPVLPSKQLEKFSIWRP